MREYRTIRALRRGEVMDLGGIKFKMDVDDAGKEQQIKAGDLYIAERNTGPHLLTAQEVVMSECGCHVSYIHSTCNAYSFDGGECVKVCEAT